MTKANRLPGIALATAAAAVFATATLPTAQAADSNVKCMGVNACKGLSSCKSASHACKGQNSWKGQGFVLVPKGVCKQLGGKVG